MTSLSNTPRISIFDIPHILDLICDDLSKDQLLLCLEVSRTWRSNFTPQAIRHIRFSNLKSHQTWTILRSARLIRSLTIDIADAGWFLDNTFGSSYYPNLRELHCVDFNYSQKPKPVDYYYYTRPSIVDHSQNALRLINSCPKLRSLTVDHLSRQYRSDNFTEDIFKSIYTHTSLATIKIHLECVPYEFSTVLIKSLPASLKDFELSVKCWIPSTRLYRWSPAPRQFYPKEGYPWQQQGQDSMESSTFLGARTFPLERLALGGLHKRRRPWWEVSLAEDTEPAVVIDHVVPNPERDISYYSNIWAYIGNEMVKPIVERSSALRHLVLKAYRRSWINLLQLLLDNCPDLETINLSGSPYSFQDNFASNDTQLTGSFVALKEFRMSGIASEHTYIAVGNMILRSAATIEVVWIDRDNWGQAEEGVNPFHIGTTASWTQCTRLKELGISLKGGSLMKDYRWEVPLAFSVFESIKDYSTVFGQLGKLRLAVKESLWEECTYGNFNGGEEDYWDDYDYYSNYNEFYGIDFDEKDDEDWKPLTAVTPTEEEKTREHAERNHQRAFILQVRELFGRLKDLKQLRELEIDWTVCFSISEMMLQDAQELFRETEGKDNNNNGGYERSSKGWWGEVTQEDLDWLCLPWYSQPAPQSSGAPSEIIKAAAHQYKNNTPLTISCNDNSDYSGMCPAWSTGDIYNTRIGRHWKDWADVVRDSHPYGDPCSSCHGTSFSCYGWYDHTRRHSSRSYNVVQYGRDFESFVMGVAGEEESGWGRKMTSKGDRGRYRQKAVGKMNQRK